MCQYAVVDSNTEKRLLAFIWQVTNEKACSARKALMHLPYCSINSPGYTKRWCQEGMKSLLTALTLRATTQTAANVETIAASVLPSKAREP